MDGVPLQKEVGGSSFNCGCISPCMLTATQCLQVCHPGGVDSNVAASLQSQVLTAHFEWQYAHHERGVATKCGHVSCVCLCKATFML